MSEAPATIPIGFDSSWDDVRGCRVIYPGEIIGSNEQVIEYVRSDKRVSDEMIERIRERVEFYDNEGRHGKGSDLLRDLLTELDNP